MAQKFNAHFLENSDAFSVNFTFIFFG
jgi:hypothetical protein